MKRLRDINDGSDAKMIKFDEPSFKQLPLDTVNVIFEFYTLALEDANIWENKPDYCALAKLFYGYQIESLPRKIFLIFPIITVTKQFSENYYTSRQKRTIVLLDMIPHDVIHLNVTKEFSLENILIARIDLNRFTRATHLECRHYNLVHDDIILCTTLTTLIIHTDTIINIASLDFITSNLVHLVTLSLSKVYTGVDPYTLNLTKLKSLTRFRISNTFRWNEEFTIIPNNALEKFYLHSFEITDKSVNLFLNLPNLRHLEFAKQPTIALHLLGGAKPPVSLTSLNFSFVNADYELDVEEVVQILQKFPANQLTRLSMEIVHRLTKEFVESFTKSQQHITKVRLHGPSMKMYNSGIRALIQALPKLTHLIMEAFSWRSRLVMERISESTSLRTLELIACEYYQEHDAVLQNSNIVLKKKKCKELNLTYWEFDSTEEFDDISEDDSSSDEYE
jgi:hypothetical protein